MINKVAVSKKTSHDMTKPEKVHLVNQTIIILKSYKQKGVIYTK